MGTEPNPTPPPPSPPPSAPQPLSAWLQPPPVKQINSDTEDRTWAALCHLGGVLGFLIPLVLWMMKKDESRFIEDQGKEALNFQLTLLIGDVLGFITLFIYIGIVILLAVWGTRLAFALMATMAANKGDVYRYPFAIRFVK
jgi:uncharacterized Tic20 family protein